MRRSQAAGGASREGLRPAASSRANTKASSGCFGQSGLETDGGAGRRGGVNDQCRSNGAPSTIHRRSSATSSAASASCPR